MRIAFTVNGVPRELDAPPLRRLLDILRDDLGLTGAKEGCGEGECGACAVLLDGKLVQSCLVPAAQLGGHHVVTIEALGTKDAPDPVQQAFLDQGAVQCGFCIPGMVLATRALLAQNPQPDDQAIRTGLAGNICRCTGYERIVRAVRQAADSGPASGTGVDRSVSGENLPPKGVTPSATPIPAEPRAASIASIQVDTMRTLGASAPAGAEPATNATIERRRAAREGLALSPTTLAEALAVLQTTAEGSHGGATGPTVVAGGTDFMLPGALAGLARGLLLDLSRVEGLEGVRLRDDVIELGAATTVATLADDPAVSRHLPALASAARLFGAPAIRNRATLGGNLAGGSPAADLPPPLLALGAVVILASTAGEREVPIEVFTTGYRKTQRRIDELIVAVRVPLPAPHTHQAFFKAGTRRAQSIARASVAAVARVDTDGTLRGVRLAAGSVAPVPILLPQTMQLLEGRRLGAALIDEAGRVAAAEITPIEDVRSNIAYRRYVTGRLVERFLRQCCRT